MRVNAASSIIPGRIALEAAHACVWIMKKKTATGKTVAILLDFPGKRSRTGWQLPDKLEPDQWTTYEGRYPKWKAPCNGGSAIGGPTAKRAYGDRAALFEEGGPLEGLNSGTLANYGSIARRISPSHRCEVLSFKHHEHVASLSPAQQSKWLKRAVKEDWTSRQLKSAIDAELLPAPAASDERRKAEYAAANKKPVVPDGLRRVPGAERLPELPRDIATITRRADEEDPAASGERRKIAYAKIIEAEVKSEEAVYVKAVEPPVLESDTTEGGPVDALFTYEYPDNDKTYPPWLPS